MDKTKQNEVSRTKARTLLVFLMLGLLGAGAWWWYRVPPQSPVEVHLEAGWQQFQKGDADGAERQWLRALELDRKNYVAWEALGDLYLATRQWDSAQKAYSVIAKARPETPNIWTKLARTRIGVGDAVAANAYVQIALKRNANDAQALSMLSTLLMRAGEGRQRADVLLRLAKLRPDDAAVLTKAADALSTYRRYEDAAPLVERLLQLKPDSSAGLAMRGAATFERNVSPDATKRAIVDLERAVQLQPENWVARTYLARAYLRQNQTASAIEQLVKVDALNPSDKSYLNELAIAYRQSGRIKEATQASVRFARTQSQSLEIAELDDRLNVNPNDFKVNLTLGLKVLQSNNPRGANQLLEKAVSLRPNDPKARTALEQLLKRYTDYLARADAALANKNAQQALEPLARALQLRPQDERTRYAIGKLSTLLRKPPDECVLILERTIAP